MLNSSNHRRLVGFSFDNAFAATEFHIRVQEFIADPENTTLRDSNNNKKSSNNSSFLAPNSNSSDKRRLYRRHSFSGSAKRQWLKKAHISTPCCFQHITSIRPNDMLSAKYSMGDLNSSISVLTRSSSRTPSSEEDFPKRAQSCIQIVGHLQV